MSWRDNGQYLARVLKEKLFVSQAAVGVRLLTPEEESQGADWLEKIRRPGGGLPEKMLVCQAMAMVRYYGWRVLVTPDSLDCPTGLIAMGWVEISPEYRRGDISVTPFNQSKEARGRRMELVPGMTPGQVAALAAAPLDDCPFEPQVAVIYCTPAQAMRLVQSALFHEGGAIQSTSSGAQGCSQYITKVYQTGRPRYILPGNGDRIFGHVEEHQMAFSLPADQAGRLAEGIEKSHEGGQMYPLPAYIRSQFKVPKAYEQASEHLRQYTRSNSG